MSVTGPVSRLGDRRFRVGDAAIFLEKQAGIITAGLTEGCPATVIGLSAAYDSPQIWPRSQADVIPGDCTPAACEPLTISQIQGSGDASPFDGKTGLACLTGCVTGVTADGFTLQSPEPDTDPRTSEGIYAYRYSSWTNPRGLRPGDLVELRNFDVQEYYDQTEIVGLKTDTEATYRVTGRCELPAAVPVPPLTDPDADPASMYEPFEGMRVCAQLRRRGDRPDRPLRLPLSGGRPRNRTGGPRQPDVRATHFRPRGHDRGGQQPPGRPRHGLPHRRNGRRSAGCRHGGPCVSDESDGRAGLSVRPLRTDGRRSRADPRRGCAGRRGCRGRHRAGSSSRSAL